MYKLAEDNDKVMQPRAAEYVASLKQARAHEIDRRNLRKKRRNEYLTHFQDEMDGFNRSALHQHIKQPTSARSEMEKQLVDFVHKTAVWWGSLCEQSIEQRIRYEKSLEDQRKRRQEYLNNVEMREHNEYDAVCESEATRWEDMGNEFEEYEKEMKDTAINAARESIIDAAEQCVQLMEDYCISSSKDNWLVQFAFKKITNASEFSQPSEEYHKEAFRVIFGGQNAYGLTGISFKELIDFSYQWCDSDKRATYEFDACEVPIFMLEGAKLSGKSLLADALEKKFNLVRFNDRSLIEKALSSRELYANAACIASTARLDRKALGKGPENNTEDQLMQNDDADNEAANSAHAEGDNTPILLSGNNTLNETGRQQLRLESGSNMNNDDISLISGGTASPEDAIQSGSQSLLPPGSVQRDAGVEKGDGSAIVPPVSLSAEDTSSESSGVAAEWIALGDLIRGKLYRGEAIEQSVTAQLLRLELQELKQDQCNGVIFEGVLNRVVEVPSLLNSLVPKRSSHYALIHRLWCEGLDDALEERARLKAESEAEAAEAAAAEATAAQAAAQAAAAEEEAARPARSPRKKHRSNSRASMMSPSTVLDAVPVPPSPPPEGVPAILAVSRVRIDEPAKKEVRGKGAKRGVDLSQLPPPVLPPVDDIDDLVKTEEEFVARALEELNAYTGLLSCIMYVNCSQEEIFRRYAGLRIDRDTSEQYHLLYNPPPKDRVPYLIGCDRTVTFSSQLYDVVFRQKKEWIELRHWLLRQMNLKDRVNELEGDRPLEQIEADAEELVKRAIASFHVGKRLYDSMLDARERIALLKRTRDEQVAAREAERVRLAELYAEKGVPLPPELEQAGDTGEWCCVPQDVPLMVLKSIEGFHDVYGKTYKAAWAEFSALSCMILEYRRSARLQLKRFWRQPDDKQSILDRFLRQFNTVPKRFRSKAPCKEELHLLTDELSSSLFASVETKKKDGFALIDHVVRRDAYLDGWEANICNIGALLVQQEVERFTLVANLSMLYFAASHEEPVMFEEVDTDVNLIRTLEAATGDLAGGGKNKTEKKSVSARKGAHGRPNEENGDSSILEAFIETVQRLSNGISSLTEKFRQKVSADASGRGQKKVTLRSLKLSAITAGCAPFLETEQAATLQRIGCVKRFVSELARQGEAYMQSIKAEMLAEAKDMLLQQAASVNSAVFAIRCAIEEEEEVSPMHLGCGTFAILKPKIKDRDAVVKGVQNPAFLTDVPLYATVEDRHTLIHDTLNASRLLEIIERFRCAAPQFQLCQDSFATIITDEDYAGAAKEGEYLLSPSEVFRAFDPMGTGVVDWRELIMHLLFWCCPPGVKGDTTLYIPEVTIAELRDMKKHLGIEPVNEEQFRECPFFFDKYLKADRRDVYVRSLWYTFQNPLSGTVDPFELLCFFCIDQQPVRGAQKAFCLFSDSSNAKLTMPVLERVLHIRATNARAMALVDPFSKPNLYLLLNTRKEISFQEMCSCAMGRHMFNRLDFMMRKRFVCSGA